MQSHWYQLNHMQIICTSLRGDMHASTSSLTFTARYSSWRPDNHIKALTAYKIPKTILMKAMHKNITISNTVTWRSSNTRKYMLATRWNCSKRFFGKKEYTEYLPVLITFGWCTHTQQLVGQKSTEPSTEISLQKNKTAKNSEQPPPTID